MSRDDLYRKALANIEAARALRDAGATAAECRPYQRKAWELYEASRRAGGAS